MALDDVADRHPLGFLAPWYSLPWPSTVAVAEEFAVRFLDANFNFLRDFTPLSRP
jgi:hypothetical protein